MVRGKPSNIKPFLQSPCLILSFTIEIINSSPRTTVQAEKLDEMVKLDKAVYINAPDDVMLERITARETCPKCGFLSLLYQPFRNAPAFPKGQNINVLKNLCNVSSITEIPKLLQYLKQRQLRVNTSGVISIIFAISLLQFPEQIGQFVPNIQEPLPKLHNKLLLPV